MQFRIQLKKTWNELTEDDIESIARDPDSLVRVVLSRYPADLKAGNPFRRSGVVRIERITAAILEQRAGPNCCSEAADAHSNWRQLTGVKFLHQMVGAAVPKVSS